MYDWFALENPMVSGYGFGDGYQKRRDMPEFRDVVEPPFGFRFNTEDDYYSARDELPYKVYVCFAFDDEDYTISAIKAMDEDSYEVAVEIVDQNNGWMI